MFIEEKLSNIPFKSWWKDQVSKVVPWEDVKSLMRLKGSKNFRHLYVQLHDAEWRQLLKTCHSYQEMEERTGLSRRWLSENLRMYGYLPKDSAMRKNQSFEERFRVKLFQGETFNELESYFYGFYLGDGSTRMSQDGKRIVGVDLVCRDPRDYGNFELLSSLTGLDLLRYGSELKLYLNEFVAIENLTRLGLLFPHKSVVHGKVTQEMLGRFHFLSLFRGLVDTDGGYWIKHSSSGREFQNLRIQMVWGELLEAISIYLRRLGIECNFRKCPKIPSKGVQYPYSLELSRFSLVKLLDLGYYSWNPDLELERKRIVDWRVLYPELPRENSGNNLKNGLANRHAK